jgi:ribosomal protein L29
MKIKDKAKLNQLSGKELTAKLAALQTELVAARMQLRLGKAKNTRQGTQIRRDIARLKTLITKQPPLSSDRKA